MAAANLMVVLHVAAAWQVGQTCCGRVCTCGEEPAPSQRTADVAPADMPPVFPGLPRPGLPFPHCAQVFAMPIFDAVETSIRHIMRSPPRPLVLRLVFRSAYVVAVTVVACLLPFFGELM